MSDSLVAEWTPQDDNDYDILVSALDSELDDTLLNAHDQSTAGLLEGSEQHGEASSAHDGQKRGDEPEESDSLVAEWTPQDDSTTTMDAASFIEDLVHLDDVIAAMEGQSTSDEAYLEQRYPDEQDKGQWTENESYLDAHEEMIVPAGNSTCTF